MGLLDHLCGPDVNRGVLEYSLVSGAVLLDVRTQQEFNDGHIPGSVNLPLQMLDNADEIIENVDVPLYVYCRSGARSRQAVMVLKSMGYRNVTNIGGISAYTGKVER
ncbi:MAG: rhodanese-like domain-containing protein [Oscillospiraceae bacterium]|nr:rhodanese-like domain-containing protein [Oscillospiraceae bacterium]